MFKTRRTKIVSAPAEEILEVVATEPVAEPEPVEVTVYNIEQLTINAQDDETAIGELIDSNGDQYKYVWDKKLKRISSLTGERIDSLIWMLCDTVLNKYYVRPEPKSPEQPVEVKIAEALKVTVAPIISSIKSLENKVATVRPAPAPAPQAAPRPQIVQSSAPVNDTPAINVADADISVNAMRFLQESTTPDLGIDYMSL